jgi:molybdopterin-guanine dinucleotide biosynthesis protein A
VLAGGRARRLGGADKAELVLAGRPLIAHALARLGPQCQGLAINANGDPARFAAYGATVLPDTVAGFVGPLAGVLAGLDHARDNGFDDVLTLSVDAPFAPRDLAARLRQARTVGRADIAVAASGGRRHHVIALWPVRLAEALREALVGEGLRKVERFVERGSVVEVEWPAAPLDPFFNVNTPEDLAEAERLARSGVDG